MKNIILGLFVKNFTNIPKVRFRPLIVAVVYLFLPFFYLQQVRALSADQKKAIQSGIYYFNTENKCINSGNNGPLQSPLFPNILDTAELENRITEYIKSVEPTSGLINNSADFVKYGKQYNVNPVLLVLVGQKETQLGTDGGNGNPPKHNFWGNRSGSGWASYPNYTAAIEGYFNNLRTNTAYAKVWAKGDLATVEEIIYIATPPSDGNDTAGYTKFVNEVLEKILGSLVNSTNISSNGCGAGGNAGVLGWELTGPNAMVSYEQIDKKWADKEYGKGLASIGETGCGPASLAMIGATLLGNSSITPLTLANEYGDRFHTPGGGSSWGIIPAFASDYNLNMTDLGTDFSAAANILKAGGLVLVSVDPGWFTTYGHFMVIRSVSADGSSFFMNDPNGAGLNKDSETRAFSTDFMRGEGAIKKMWGFTK